MAQINKYYEKKKLVEQLAQELEELENSEALKGELEFERQVKALLEEYDKSPWDVVSVLAVIDPTINEGTRTSSGTGPKRPLQVYKNPHTGEVLKTRGGNHKLLKEWRSQYGKETVASWKAE